MYVEKYQNVARLTASVFNQLLSNTAYICTRDILKSSKNYLKHLWVKQTNT